MRMLRSERPELRYLADYRIFAIRAMAFRDASTRRRKRRREKIPTPAGSRTPVIDSRTPAADR